MRERIAWALVITALVAGASGCRQKVDRAALISAINKSFAGRHECTWPQPIELPAEVNPSKDARVAGFEALTDAGLLIRELVVKKPTPAGSDPDKKYALSDKGHALWTPQPDQPGYGNFCFGRFNATAIDKATPNDPSNPTQYTVTYSYEVEGIPAWMRTPESMRTFRKIAADTSIQSATATLVKGADGGWTVAPQQLAQ
jgi:hypothetical protein